MKLGGDEPDHQSVRMALRAARLPTGLYLLLLVLATILIYATADVHGQVPAPTEWLTLLTSGFGVFAAGWAGYRAMQWTRRRRWAILAGLLVAAISDGVLLLLVVTIEASRSAGLGQGLTASGFAAELMRNAIRVGFDCLIAAAVAWFGSLVTVGRTRT